MLPPVVVCFLCIHCIGQNLIRKWEALDLSSRHLVVSKISRAREGADGLASNSKKKSRWHKSRLEKRSTKSSTCEKELVTFNTTKFSVSQHCDTNTAGVRNYAMVKGMDYAGWPRWYFGNLTSVQPGTKFPLSPSHSISIFLRVAIFRLGYAPGGTQKLS